MTADRMETDQPQAASVREPAAPLRILFVATEWVSTKGGVSTFNRDLASAVAALQGTEVWCAVPESPGAREVREASGAGVGILAPGNPLGIARDNHTARLLCRMREAFAPDGSQTLDADEDQIECRKFDAVVGHGRWTGPAAVELARRHRIGVIVQFVHVDPAIEFDKDRQAPSGQRYDENNSVDLALCEAASIRFGVGPRLANLFRHKIDVEQLLPGFEVAASTRSGQPRHALLVGRMEDSGLKGLHYALYAMQTVSAREMTETVLELRGAHDEDSTLKLVRELLEDVRKQRTMLDHNRLTLRVTPFSTAAGHINDSYQKASVVLMPSTQEGFGLVALEALSRGRPVVVSHNSGFAMLVQDIAPELAPRFVYESERIGPREMERVGRVADRISDLVNAFFDDPEGAKEAVASLQAKLATVCSWERAARQLVRSLQDKLAAPDGAGSSTPTDTDPRPSSSVVPPASPASARPQDPLERASVGLRSWPRQIRGGWIDRKEQTGLLAAVRDDGNPGLVCLMGGPGVGKSALLGWLDDQLRGDGWSVLSIKADQLPADGLRNGADLSRWLGLGGADILTLLKDRRAGGGRVALIVDQLDALAALTDLKTARLNVLLSLIYRCVGSDGVRVVASMREMESRYDARLRRLSGGRRGRPNATEVKVGPLDPAAVRVLWTRATGEVLDRVPAHLLEPRTLKLATEIQKPLSGSREVVNAFWQEFVEVSDESLKGKLYHFVATLENTESFWASIDDEAAARHWVDRGVLESQSSSVDKAALYAFAHQTLQEEARARRWLSMESDGVDPAESLARWTEERLDLLNIRPRIISVLDVLRTNAYDAYVRAVGLLLCLSERRLHLRELIAVQIGRSETPTEVEVAWMRTLMADHEPGVRFASIAAAAGRPAWFDALLPWIEAQLDTEDGLRFQHFLAAAWPFASSTVEDWLRRYWAVGLERTRAALWVMSERMDWPDEASDLALFFARPDVDEMMLGALTSTISRHNSTLAARVRARYAARFWERASNLSEDAADRYRVPIDYDWRRIATQAPAAFVQELLPAFLGLTEVLSDARGRSGFRECVDSLLYDSRSFGDQFEDSALAAFEDALRTLASTDIEIFKTIRTRLQKSDAELAQLIALRAHIGCAAAHPEELVDTLLEDTRRLRLNPPLSEVLAAVVPRLSADHKARLLDVVAVVERVVPAEVGINDPGYVAAMADHNAQYRSGLTALILQGPSDPSAQRLLDERSYKVGTVVSPCSREDFAALSEDERLELIRSYHDGKGDNELHEWRAGAFVGGNDELASEIGIWAKSDPWRALGLLSALRSEEDPTSPRQLSVVSSLLHGLAESDELTPADWLDAFRRTVSEDYGLRPEGRRSSNFRHLVALGFRRILENGGDIRGADLLDLLIDWIGADPVPPVDDEAAEALEEDALLFPHVPGPLIASGSTFTQLDVLSTALVRSEPRDWNRLLTDFEHLLPTVGGEDWCHLLVLRRFRPPLEYRARWQDWLTSLMTSRPEALARSLGVSVLWQNLWDVDEARARVWLDLVLRSRWPSATRAVAEVATMLSVVPPHSGWAKRTLENRLASISDDNVGLGVAHGLAFLWSESAVRHEADPFVQVFVRKAPLRLVRVFVSALRHGAFRPNCPFLRMASTLMARQVEWPRRQGENLTEVLLEAVEYESGAVAELALDFANSQQRGGMGFASESLLSLAFRLQRAPEQGSRRQGMELFEALLRTDRYHASRMLQVLDVGQSR